MKKFYLTVLAVGTVSLMMVSDGAAQVPGGKSVLFERDASHTPIYDPGLPGFRSENAFMEAESWVDVHSTIPQLSDNDSQFLDMYYENNALVSPFASAEIPAAWGTSQAALFDGEIIPAENASNAIPEMEAGVLHRIQMTQRAADGVSVAGATSSTVQDIVVETFNTTDPNADPEATMEVVMHFTAFGLDPDQLAMSNGEGIPESWELFNTPILVSFEDAYQLVSSLNWSSTVSPETGFYQRLKAGDTDISFIHFGGGLFYMSGTISEVSIEPATNKKVSNPVLLFGYRYNTLSDTFYAEERVFINGNRLRMLLVQIATTSDDIPGVPLPPNGNQGFDHVHNSYDWLFHNQMTIKAYTEKPQELNDPGTGGGGGGGNNPPGGPG